MEKSVTAAEEKLYGTVLFSAAVAAYILLRALKIAESDLWSDEVFSILTVRQDWAAMFSSIVSDAVHPPLFYILLKLWASLDSSVFWLRLFPFFVSILTLLPLYLFCRALKLNLSEAAAAFLLIAVNSFFLEYALDLRMYGLVQFFTLVSLWLFVELQQSKDIKWASVWILAFVNLLLIYTHYFGWLAVVSEGLYLLFWQRRVLYSFVVSSAILPLCFAPWIWLVVSNAKRRGSTGNLDWLSPPAFADLVWFYSILNGNPNVSHTTFINVLIFAFPVVFLFWSVIRRKPVNFNWRLLVFFAFAPVIFIFIASQFLPKSVWNDRYLIIAAVPYCLLFVKAAFALPNKLLRRACVGVILIWSLAVGFDNYSQPSKKIQWSAVAQEIRRENDSTNSAKTVYVFEQFVSLPLQLYLEEAAIPARVEKINALNVVPEKSFLTARRVFQTDAPADLPELWREKNCHIIGRNLFFGGEQAVELLSVAGCVPDNF